MMMSIHQYWIVVSLARSISSSLKPYTSYKYAIELVPGLADLWWNVDDVEKGGSIVFELHAKTLGWVGFGISPGNRNVSLCLLIILIIRFIHYSWRHERSRYRRRMDRFVRHVTFRSMANMSSCRFFIYLCDRKDRYAIGNSRPIRDNTTIDWLALQGREENGWSAIQFRRLLDTCDTMDVPIKVIRYLHSNIRCRNANVV
jgi:hypothetical protein